MSMHFTNRVYLPDGNKIYVSDDQAGGMRLEELYDRYGNLTVEVCDKVWGRSLDEQTVVFKTNIEEFFS